jgi:tetratricopeptide (TPR) repeat protein
MIEGAPPKTILCIICRQPIDVSAEPTLDDCFNAVFASCPNGHVIHVACLRDWMVQGAPTCPFCSTPYGEAISNAFQEYAAYLAQVCEAEEAAANEAWCAAEAAAQAALDAVQVEIDEAERWVEAGEYKRAVDRAWSLIDGGVKGKQHSHCLLLLGRAYLGQRQTALAIKQLMNLVRDDFDYPLGFYYLGLAYESLSLNDKAVWAFKRALTNIENQLAREPMNPRYQALETELREKLGTLAAC